MAAIKKEKIKDQMIKTAARLWEIQENEIEANFDPLVILLIEACAAELEKIGYSIRESHQRLIERLAELLIPDASTGAFPASCILQAQPGEGLDQLDSQHAFSLQKAATGFKNDYSGTAEMIPVGRFSLADVSLEWYASGGRLYKTNANGTRELVYGDESRREDNTIWLALQAGKQADTLQGLHIFFNLRKMQGAGQFYFGLQQASGRINGEAVNLRPGFQNANQFKLTPAEMLGKGHHYLEKIKRSIAQNYAPQFIHIDSPTRAVAGFLPDALSSWLPPEQVKKLSSEKLIYLEIRLPRPYPQELLEAVSCHVNAFPVVNLKRHQVQYRSNDWVNVVPLPIEGLFADLTEVTGSSGSPYHFRYAAGNRQPEEGEALLRRTGVGNVSSSEIREMSENLMEAIRDQYAFFSDISNQVMLNQLREINIMLNRLEDRLQVSTDLVEAKYYLLVRPAVQGELIMATYYTTLGPAIHGVKAYTPVQPLRHSATRNHSVFTITPWVGGRDLPSKSEKQMILKQQLLSRGKIITAEDIRLASHRVLEHLLESAEVNRITEIEPGAKAGFRNCIQVKLRLKDEAPTTPEETQYLMRQLEQELCNQALPGLSFVVKLAEK